MKFTKLFRIALGLVAVATAWIAFQLGTHRHTGILRILAGAKHFIEAKHFITDAPTFFHSQQPEAKLPPGPQHTVTLSWKPSTSAVVGYNVYRRGASGVIRLNFAPVSATSYVDSTVSAGQTYFYVTKAVSAKGPESAPSNEVRADVPTP